MSWYESPWFILLGGIAIAGLIFLFMYFAYRNDKKHNDYEGSFREWLNKEKEKKENEL